MNAPINFNAGLEIEPRVLVEIAYDHETLRFLRALALKSARYYRDNYFREGFGFERRMLRHMLDQARDYRAREKTYALV